MSNAQGVSQKSNEGREAAWEGVILNALKKIENGSLTLVVQDQELIQVNLNAVYDLNR